MHIGCRDVWSGSLLVGKTKVSASQSNHHTTSYSHQKDQHTPKCLYVLKVVCFPLNSPTQASCPQCPQWNSSHTPSHVPHVWTGKVSPMFLILVSHPVLSSLHSHFLILDPWLLRSQRFEGKRSALHALAKPFARLPTFKTATR